MSLRHKYYLKSKREKTFFKIWLVLCSIIVLGILVFLGFLFEIYFVVFLILWMLISILAPFVDTPGMVQSGKLFYFSPFLLGEKQKDGQIVVHGATLFDYYFTLEHDESGTQRKNQVLEIYFQGLLSLLNSKHISDEVIIKGTTYIMNERTARKLGFEVKDPDMTQYLILILNYPNLLVSKSFVSKKLSLPTLSKTKTFTADLASLRKHKNNFEAILTRLKH